MPRQMQFSSEGDSRGDSGMQADLAHLVAKEIHLVTLACKPYRLAYQSHLEK